MKLFFFVPVLFSATLLGCGVADDRSSMSRLDPLTDIKPAEAFTCAHEALPELPADADVLYQYAKWLQYDQVPPGYPELEILRLYRIAAENGHYKANIELQRGALGNKFFMGTDDRLRLSKLLIKQKIGMGYHYIGALLQKDLIKLDEDPRPVVLRYYRKAADMGSAEAQTFMGNKIRESGFAPDVAWQMWQCAADQGDSEAFVGLGWALLAQGRKPEAVIAFQRAAAAGDSTGAYLLERGFREHERLNLDVDLERAERYRKIYEMLSEHSDFDPEFPEIDEVVPMPPAALPAWDGKLRWLEAHLSRTPPEKPPVALINKLAKAKGLDPETGMPMPISPRFPRTVIPASVRSAFN